MFVIKVIIGLTMMAFIYYMTTELFSEKSQQPLQNQDFEIEVGPD